MSYTKHTWETGETITAEKLNNLENGIDNCSVFFVDFTIANDSVTCEQTTREVYEACIQGKRVIGRVTISQSGGSSSSYIYPTGVGTSGDNLIVFFESITASISNDQSVATINVIHITLKEIDGQDEIEFDSGTGYFGD